MSAPDGGGMSAQTAVELSSGSESGSSYVGSGESSTHHWTCQWRNTRFHDQECSRYFDCPSHIVERVLSDNGEVEAEGEQDDYRHERDEHYDEHVEHGDSETTDERGDHHHHSEPRTVSPVSERSMDASQERRLARTAVSPLPEPLAPDYPRPASSGGEEIQITGSRVISRGSQLQDNMDRSSTPRVAGSGTSENPIVLWDDSPAQTPHRRQPSITSSSASGSRAEQGRVTAQPVEAPEGDHSPAPIAVAGGGRPTALPPIPTYGNAGASEAETFLSTDYRPFSSVPEPRSPPEVVIPRWQPDAEVTYCPICRTQFSIFVRKHHCRKCGRVVCNACSPHRITIPYQYIVQPPGTPRPQQRYTSSYLGDSDFSILGGGERVRLCNPCVPDPNIAPPQTPGAHSRSQSSLPGPFPGHDTRPVSNGWSSYFGAVSSSDLHARSRSVTMQAPGASGSRAPSSQYPQMSIENRILSGTPPVSLPSGSSSQRHTQQQQQRAYYSRYRTLLDLGGTSGAGPSSAAGPSSSSHINDRRLLPLPPLPGTTSASSSSSRPQQHYQIPEEDECPVCHRELPPRNLPNFEALREAHITICITSHSTYSGGVPSSSSGIDVAAASGSPPLPPPPPRLTGMFPYVATEKDCVDSAECTICLEEFEVGVPMARLECLCRFHRVCICAWWERHPGRCPVHQHDGFGY